MSTVVVVQARMGSSRLPGKVLADIGGVPMIEKIIARSRRAQHVDDIVVATTVDSNDDGLAANLQSLGVRVVRGHVYDVLERFGQVLDSEPELDVLVRITADCPFVDPDVIDAVISARSESGADFAANRLPPPAQRTYPVGLDVEVCTRDALSAARREAKAPHQREHVMPFLYEHAERFAIRILDLPEDLSSHRWTVDTNDDLDVARALNDLAGDEPYSWRRVLEVAEANPWIERLNARTIQKDVRAVDDRWGHRARGSECSQSDG